MAATNTNTSVPATNAPTTAAPVAVPGAPQTFQSASLYVGDLHPETDEAALFQLFQTIGHVAHIRVCRDHTTRRSLGYAYVNFSNEKDADRAINTYNFHEIKGRACRIMWSQRDPSARKSGLGNIFVKNLPEGFENKNLYDVFSEFGNILSCKVAMDETGKSKGYGYVHFETGEEAQKAIEKLNGGTLIVGIFVKRQDRAGQADWTNLYAKQFPESWDEEKLKAVFGEHGAIASVVINRDAEGKSKRFGFVNFTDHEGAQKALDALNNRVMPDDEAAGTTFTLYVNRHQKKVERSREISARMATLNLERASKYQGMNLYVKNIDDSISDEFFRETFAKFGTITSARIMRDPADNTSKGFGFVCYSTPEDASRAVSEMNNQVLKSKPIVVTLHQRKDQRKAHLAATYNNPNALRFQQPAMGGIPYGIPPIYGVPGNQPPGAYGNRNFSYPQNFAGQPRGQPRAMQQGFPNRGPAPGGYMQNGPYMQYQGMQMPQNAMNNQNNFNRMKGQPLPQNAAAPRGAIPGRGMPQQMQPGRGMPQQMQQGGRPMQNMPMQAAGRQNGNIRFSNQVRNQPGPNMQPMMAVPANQQVQYMQPMGNGLDEVALANADPTEQKQILGERLYHLIGQQEPERAGKITGMLLEMDTSELLNLIVDNAALSSKIEEAITVLSNSASAQQ